MQTIIEAVLSFIWSLFGKQRQARRVDAAEQAVADAPETRDEVVKELRDGRL